MAPIRRAPAGALALALILAAGPAGAQGALQGASLDPGAKAGRSLTSTGQTKPPGAPGAATGAAAPLPKPATEAEMIKAQKAAEARSKAWDARTRRTMGSICSGC